MREKKIIYIVIDGLGDRPIKELKNKTPLDFANTPNMDRMAKKGFVGIHFGIYPGVSIGSGLAHILLFGLDPNTFPGRGVLEALGLNLNLKKGDLLFRINFATINNKLIVTDRRAKRNDYKVIEIINDLNKMFKESPFDEEIKIFKGKDHRGVLLIRNGDLSIVEDFDPYIEGKKAIFPNVKKCKDMRKRKILKIIDYLLKAYKFLNKHKANVERRNKGLPPVNFILVRGAGIYEGTLSFKELYGMKAATIADTPLYLGIGRFLGMDVFKIEDDKKIEKACSLLNKYDFIFIHFKKSDEFSHDGLYKEKVKYLEELDNLFSPLLDMEDVLVTITGDHATPCEMKTHSGDPVPFLIYRKDLEWNIANKFSEKECMKGVTLSTAKQLFYVTLNLANRPIIVPAYRYKDISLKFQ